MMGDQGRSYLIFGVDAADLRRSEKPSINIVPPQILELLYRLSYLLPRTVGIHRTLQAQSDAAGSAHRKAFSRVTEPTTSI